MSKQHKLEETNYTADLKTAIDSYISDSMPRAYIPKTTSQGIGQLNKSKFFDLVKKISNSQLLILEIKVTDDKKSLKSYNKRQHEINKVLHSYNIPIMYCYNLLNSYEEVDNSAVLKHSNVENPLRVCDDKGILCNAAEHRDLQTYIDQQLKVESAGDDIGGIAAILSKGYIDYISDINLGFLLFAYNKKAQEMILIDADELKQIHKFYEENIVTNGDKIVFKTASDKEIKEYIESAQKFLTDAISKFKSSQNVLQKKILK